MNGNPTEDWRALTENYRSMGDEELCELARAFDDLTPAAQQILRDEMKLRALGDPGLPGWTHLSEQDPGARTRTAAGPAIANSGSDLPVEYTWKTLLCQCETLEQTRQIAEALKRAGIESWTDQPNLYTPLPDMDLPGPRLLVAADQLEEARLIASQPIAREIVEQSGMAAQEFDVPVCPKCGAEDPVLEDVDPVNAWKCELCGAEWTDPDPQTAEEAEAGGR